MCNLFTLLSLANFDGRAPEYPEMGQGVSDSIINRLIVSATNASIEYRLPLIIYRESEGSEYFDADIEEKFLPLGDG